MLEDNQDLITGASVKERLKDQPFRVEMEINGLPFTFEGAIPKIPTGLKWFVSVPNWQVHLDKMRIAKEKGILTDNDFIREFERSKGIVGTITVDGAMGHLLPSGIYIVHMQSFTVFLQEEYRNARGIGRSLLENVLALADHRNWVTYLVPENTSEYGMSDKKLIEWYQRKGFKFKGDTMTMFREPQMPDEKQVISKLIQTNKSSY